MEQLHTIAGGLSPRVWGNPRCISTAAVTLRSIPACAGEPRPSASPARCGKVYPRVCGGTLTGATPVAPFQGLSPRVRGNPTADAAGPGRQGSIPACAGEPPVVSVSPSNPGVYPRVCGGTAGIRILAAGQAGLSPRVRGNRRRGGPKPAGGGSIPACAGEPNGNALTGYAGQVYPRVCGGTAMAPKSCLLPAGLSPRVRGNLRAAVVRVVKRGSIPACAGEPRPDRRRRRPRPPGVYPRVCGGTRLRQPVLPPPWGLSPRVRGNLNPPGYGNPAFGSIPACAGEPNGWRQRSKRNRVYPRVCGGTYMVMASRSRTSGLSPRVRGNPGFRTSVHSRMRSIPACAGEPQYAGKPCWTPSVYPRVCGGTGNSPITRPTG